MKRPMALLAVLVLLAGCTGGGPVTIEPGVSDETTGSDVPKSTATTWTETIQSTVNPVRESVTPAGFPDQPDELTEDSVAACVESY